MNVPPFVPQPIAIQQNVAEERYLTRLRFIKRVTFLHLVSMCVVLLSALYLSDRASWSISGGTSLALLLALTVVRGVVRGRPMEQRISGLLTLPLLVSIGVFGSKVGEFGWPIWAMLLPPLLGSVYALCCGRDLSFIGMFLIAWVGSWATVPLVIHFRQLDWYVLGPAFAASLGYAFYYVYDLAALLSRRRLREEVGAVADLYRDSLNFLGYGVRVWNHWKKHRIWSAR